MRLALPLCVFLLSVSAARADDAIDSGLAILREQRQLRPELLGEDVYRVEVGGEAIGYFRTVTTEDEVQGKPAYRIRGQSLSSIGGREERMEYLYLAYPDLTPVHYQRSRIAEEANGAAPDTYLLLLEGDHFRIQRVQGEPIEKGYEAGLVGFDLVTHLARIVPADATGPVAFRMLDEDGSIRRVEFRIETPAKIPVGGVEVETRRLVHTGLAGPSGSAMEFRFWIDAEGSILRFEGDLGNGGVIRFEAMALEEWTRMFGSPVEAAVDFLLALAARDGATLERRIDFHEAFLLSISKNELHRNVSGEDLERLWTAAAESYPRIAIAALLAEPAPFAPSRNDPAETVRARLESLETSSGERAVVRYQPPEGDPVYLYLRRSGNGWQVVYVTREK